jgi:hypothetical protein
MIHNRSRARADDILHRVGLFHETDLAFLIGLFDIICSSLILFVFAHEAKPPEFLSKQSAPPGKAQRACERPLGGDVGATPYFAAVPIMIVADIEGVERLHSIRDSVLMLKLKVVR